MVNSEWQLTFSTLRKMAILYYNLVLFTSLIATAIRDLHCEVALHPPGQSELSQPMQSRPAMATTDTWPRRILYAAAAVAGTKKDQGVRPQTQSESSHQKTVYFGSNNSTNADDGHDGVSDNSCDGAHGIELDQDNTTFYLDGLPVYHVTVMNTCLDCSVQDIHIACEDWASATEVNPLVFKRIAYNDCIVNDGKPISSQGVVFFEYTNSFPYPMHVESSSSSC
ncbi:unnamed protein product [Calypogeia fissa]